MNYGLIGYTGKLGNEVKSLFNEKKHNMVFNSSKNYSNLISDPKIIIDCSLPEALPLTIKLIKQYNIPLIIATTGFSQNDFIKLNELAEIVPVVQSYNFSIGIQILLEITKYTNNIVNDWDVEISDVHHRFKKDKPSGTAIMLDEILNRKNINITSKRLGNVVGKHTVQFGGLGEILTLSHSAISRRTFAEGILLSANFVIEKEKGFYSFSDVIKSCFDMKRK